MVPAFSYTEKDGKMRGTENNSTITVPNPFDEAARVRLEHMGLLDYKRNPRMQEMMLFARVFAGQFFDDLCEHYEKVEDLVAIYEVFKSLHGKEDYQYMYLLMSINYDYMGKPLPDPVWWLAGSSEAVMAFMIHFIKRYEQLMVGDGYIPPGEDGGS